MKYVTQSAWLELKKELFADRPLCKLCKVKSATELAHGIVHKRATRNKKTHKWLDVKENAIEICTDCQKLSETWNGRQMAWNVNGKRYGFENMEAWYDSLPLKFKEIFE